MTGESVDCPRPPFPPDNHYETMDKAACSKFQFVKELSMTPVRQRMTEDMQVRNLSPHTQASYVQQVSLFARYFGKSPEVLGTEEIRAYQVYLTNEKNAYSGRCRSLFRGSADHRSSDRRPGRFSLRGKQANTRKQARQDDDDGRDRPR